MEYYSKIYELEFTHSHCKANFYKLNSLTCEMENEEQSPLEKIKKEYEIFKQKYNLPDFDKINEDFQIEKAAEPETEILLKEIRRYMFDKISNYMRFMESLLSPVNASIFTFSILKSLNSEDKKNIEEVYKKS